MGQLAAQAQNTQMQAMNPQRQMKQLLEKSWPRIAAVMPQEMSEKRLYQMYVSTINREPQLANCSVESVLSCFMRCTSLGLEPSNVNGLGMAYILPFGNKNMRTGQKEAMFVLGLSRHDRVGPSFRPTEEHPRSGRVPGRRIRLLGG